MISGIRSADMSYMIILSWFLSFRLFEGTEKTKTKSYPACPEPVEGLAMSLSNGKSCLW